MHDADVIVCGGGPAGLAAAIACRLRGLSVTVLDGRHPPIDKPCGEGLLPEAIGALEQLGVRPADLPGVPIYGIRFIDGTEQPVEALFRNGPGRGIRRTELHRALRSRASETGVDLRWNTQVTALKQTAHTVELTTSSGSLRARWCIGADGLASRIRGWAGLENGAEHSRRIGLRQHFCAAPWSRFMEVHWGAAGQVYITPTAEMELCVAAVGRVRYRSVEDACSASAELSTRLLGTELSSAQCGAATSNRRLPRVTACRIALAGDASGSVDAITGAGLALAFQQSLAVSAAICNNDLSQYERAHRLIRRSPAMLGKLLLQMDRLPALRRLVLRSFRRKPGLFEQMLAIHTGAAPFAFLGSQGALALAVQVLLA